MAAPAIPPSSPSAKQISGLIAGYSTTFTVPQTFQTGGATVGATQVQSALQVHRMFGGV